VVDAYQLQRAVGVVVGDYGHGQFDTSAFVGQKVQHDLLDRAGGGTDDGHVLHDSVALAQPLGRPRDESW
jgi:hypothetical protein